MTVSWNVPATSHAGAYAAAHVRQTQKSVKPTPLHTSHARGCARSARHTAPKPPRQGSTQASIGSVRK